MRELYQRQAEMDARGLPYALAIVVRAVAPTSAKPGDRALVTPEGTVFGWVGGSCAEPTVVRESAAALADGQTRLVQIAPEPVQPARGDGERPGLVVVPMTCYSGGALEVFIEPHPAKPELLVAGNSPTTQALVDLGTTLGYRTTVVDLTRRPELRGATRTLDEWGPLESPAARFDDTYAVVATHGTFDEEALQWLLARSVRYLGLVTSAKRYESVRSSLRSVGVTPEQLARITAPAGHYLGAKTPAEVALSVLAQITELRRGGAQNRPDAVEGEVERPVEAAVEVASAPAASLASPSPPGGGGSCCSKKETGGTK